MVLGQGPLWSWAKDHMWSLANKPQGQARVRGRVPGPLRALFCKGSGLGSVFGDTVSLVRVKDGGIRDLSV